MADDPDTYQDPEPGSGYHGPDPQDGHATIGVLRLNDGREFPLDVEWLSREFTTAGGGYGLRLRVRGSADQQPPGPFEANAALSRDDRLQAEDLDEHSPIAHAALQEMRRAHHR